MKIILTNSLMDFTPSYPSGTLIPVTLEFNDYPLYTGHYLTQDGQINYLPGFETKPQGVSDLINVMGFQKIRFENLIEHGPWQSVAAFFNDVEDTQGYDQIMCHYGEDETIPYSLEVTIPAYAKYLRISNNCGGGGNHGLGDAIINLVV